MTLTDVIKAVDDLSPEELRRLRSYIDQREQQIAPSVVLTPDERIRMINEAVAVIREGMTQSELDQMTAAMNEEYVEPWDEAEWRE